MVVIGNRVKLIEEKEEGYSSSSFNYRKFKEEKLDCRLAVVWVLSGGLFLVIYFEILFCVSRVRDSIV